jgi:hypothetical protein
VADGEVFWHILEATAINVLLTFPPRAEALPPAPGRHRFESESEPPQSILAVAATRCVTWPPQPQFRSAGWHRRAGPRSGRHQLSQPFVNRGQRACDIEPLVGGRIFPQIGLRQFEQRHCWPRPMFLPMDKRARQLDQPFVKGAVGPLPLRQPKGFQHRVRLEESPPAKTLEVAQVARIVIAIAHASIRKDQPLFPLHQGQLCSCANSARTWDPSERREHLDAAGSNLRTGWGRLPRWSMAPGSGSVGGGCSGGGADLEQRAAHPWGGSVRHGAGAHTASVNPCEEPVTKIQ